MLVLSRHKNERLFIGDDITIVVTDIRGDKVRLGIEAPEHVKILREEVKIAIDKQRAKAAQDAPGGPVDGLTDSTPRA